MLAAAAHLRTGLFLPTHQEGEARPAEGRGIRRHRPVKRPDFGQLIAKQVRQGHSVRVDLDPDPRRHVLPRILGTHPPTVQLGFNRAVVDATSDLVCCYSLRPATYPGAYGAETMQRTVSYVHAMAPGVPVIIDAHLSDYPDGATGYIEHMRYLGADAVTVQAMAHPRFLESLRETSSLGLVLVLPSHLEDNPAIVELLVARLSDISGHGSSDRVLFAARSSKSRMALGVHSVASEPIPLLEYRDSRDPVLAELDRDVHDSNIPVIVQAPPAVLHDADGDDFAAHARQALAVRGGLSRS